MNRRQKSWQKRIAGLSKRMQDAGGGAMSRPPILWMLLRRMRFACFMSRGMLFVTGGGGGIPVYYEEDVPLRAWTV